ncbi:MAG: cytochrome b/b6 domain-containing protein [Burkholderiales bacterium]|nr:cytochrome b/b6 domain-containing protein [Burkholderiales bacterium]
MTAPVWDAMVRVFHWSLVSLFVIAVITGEIGGNAIQVHMWCGYGILTLVLFRVVWGFVGGEYARFTSFVASPMRALKFARGMLGKSHEYVTGHNPIGGWMVIALLLLLATQAGLGLFSYDEISTSGPLARYVSEETSITLMKRHRLIGDVLLILAGLHIAAVLFHLFVKGENLVRAMFTGQKSLPPALAAQASTARRGSIPLGVAVLGVAIATVAVIVNWPALFK